MQRKKKEKEPATPIDALLSLLNQGDVKVTRASNMVDPTPLRRPTGVASVDLALAGGFPSGTINQLDGQEGVGKDALLNCLMKMNQFLYGEKSGIFIGYTEPSGFDKLWARKMGVRVALGEEDIDNYEASLGAKLSGEMRADLQSQIGEVLFCQTTEAESMYRKVLLTAKSNLCQLIIINSIDGLMPKDFVEQRAKAGEIASDMQIEGGSGLPMAQLDTEFVKKYTSVCHRLGGLDRPTLVIVGQARANLATGGWQARKWSTKHGAFARRHYNTMDLQLQNKGKLPLQGEPKVGKTIGWELTKAKRDTHDGQYGEYVMYFESGPDVISDLFETLRRHDHVVQAGPKTKVMDQEGNVVVEASGSVEVMNRMRTDPSLWFSLYRMLLNTLPRPPLLGPQEKR
jgi:RecA/RadA recombinase